MATVLHLVLAEQPIQLGWVFFEPNIQNAALSYGFRLEQIQACNNIVAYILVYTGSYKYVDRFTVAQLSQWFLQCVRLISADVGATDEVCPDGQFSRLIDLKYK